MTEKALPLPSHLALGTRYPELQRMTRHLSCQRFADITGREHVSLGLEPPAGDFLYGSHLSLIQIACRELRLTFKAHFNPADFESLTTPSTKRKRSKAEILAATYDFFKEYNNLIGGAMAQHLQRCGILAGLSLPLGTSAFNEIIASDELRPHRLSDYWRVADPQCQFVCSVSLDVFQSEKLDTFVYQETEEKSGEVEIL